MINAGVRNPCSQPGESWHSELQAETDQRKGTAVCIALGLLFALTTGLIYWKVDHPHKHWILQGRLTGLLWESKKHSLVFKTISEDRAVLEVSVGLTGEPDVNVHFVKNRCRHSSGTFCSRWDRELEVRMALELDEVSHMECYNLMWKPLDCHVDLRVSQNKLDLTAFAEKLVIRERW